ncbi:unnamed protein product [Caenorhabditis brenneri]
MLYFAHLYCPCHTEPLRIYDDNTWKPCIGLCGHTVCLDCIEENVHMACPICNQPDVFVNKTPNYAAIELIEDCRDNFWELMKNWWSGENIDSGLCSKCSDQSRVLRICLTCDEDTLCNTTDSGRRLKMKVGSHLLILSRHVLCSDCAINHHDGHQTINIEKIKYSKKDIKMTTSKIILELFRRGMDNISYTTECRLRHGRIEITGRFLLVLLRELDYKEEGECGYLGELIKMELITKYIEDIDQKWEELTLFANEKKRCECNRTPPEQVTPEPFNHRQCPLCLILDHSEHKQKPTDHYRKNWLEIVENIWKNELPSLSEFCCRCLDHLNHFRVGSSCGKWDDYDRGDEMMDTDIEDEEEQIRVYRERMLRRYRDRHLRNTCQKPDCSMKDPKFWKYEIIREVVGDLGRVMDDGCHQQSFFCQLKRIRLELSVEEVYGALCEIDLRKNSREEFSLILDKMDDALELLKNRKNLYEEEIQAPTCVCSKLWARNQSVLKKLGNEDNATREPYLKFKRSMEEMAEFSLKEEIPGCPMDFDHGIVLNPIVLEELEDIDFEDSFEII